MESEWQQINLGSVAVVRSGYAFKSKDMGDKGCPIIKIKNIVPPYVNVVDVERVSLEVINGSSRIGQFQLSPGDILIAMTGATVGKIGRMPKYCGLFYLNQRVGKVFLRDTQKADYDFLYYVLSQTTNVKQIFGIADGSAQANISGAQIERLLIPLPPLQEQRAIAHILGTLDDKIECNRRMNETLEKMAQAIFKSWFVDFDPVRWNMDAKNGKAVGKPPVPPEILKLFPDSFQESELGLIPKGWEVAALSRIAHLNSESWTARNTPAEVLYVDLANTKNGRINLVVPYEFSKAPSRARRVLRKDDTIIGTVRPGNRSFAYIHEDNLTGSTGFAVMRPIEKCFSSFVYLCLSRDEVIDHFAHLADGGAYPAIRPEVVAGFKCTQPGGDIIINFNKIVYPLIRSIGEREASIRSLALLRDTLLPKLISGELRIKDAEKFIEALS